MVPRRRNSTANPAGGAGVKPKTVFLLRLPLGLFFLLSLFAAPLAARDALLEPYLSTAPAVHSGAAVLMDAATGTVLFQKNPGREIPPASLTKLMTMHIAFREIAARGLSLDDPVEISRESWAVNQPPHSSLMFLASGQRVTLRELFLGLAVSSGNDAAVAVALRFAPSVSAFAAMMNEEARRMGLKKTRFVEPSGISEENITTAGEFALFCENYIKTHPETLKEFHSVLSFAYPKSENTAEAFRDKPGTIVQNNRNTFLGAYSGADGLKTGYIDEAGYNIALTAERGTSRFLCVILGAPAQPGGDRVRDADGAALLDWAFERFKTIRPGKIELEPARLWKGREKYAKLTLADELAFTAPRDRGDNLSYSVEIETPLIAPLARAQKAGALVIRDDFGELRRVAILSVDNHETGGFLKRLWDTVRLFFWKRGLFQD